MNRVSEKLLSRDQFREEVFTRDKCVCVLCKAPAQDAHHIIDRALFPDGGYYLSNGVSVCAQDHIKCETTEVSPDVLRAAAKISTIVLPPGWSASDTYDKWGNIVLPDQTRLAGPLFHTTSVQKMLEAGGALGLFRPWVKYPRTAHVPWSQGLGDDDIQMTDLPWVGQDVVVTEKKDGENTTMYTDHLHARSVDSAHHPSRSWVKQLWSSIRHDIPKGWRFCGENCYAEHSISYSDLPSYFLLFSIWNDKQECLSWNDTLQWADLLGLHTVPELYRGPFDLKKIQQCWDPSRQNTQEGYVVRPASSFSWHDFPHVVGKFVRPNHVATTSHWMHQAIKPNGLKK